jgi:glycosyltransferase involved in cell wall biosynthesis
MNQIYVILGAPFWRAAGKKIGLWYMHGSISNTLRIAEKFSQYIFTGSPESFRLESKKVFITGHGIDTVLFTPLEVSKDIDLITVGRLSESKNLFKTVDILKEIRKKIDVSLTIVGTSVTEKEKNYEQDLFEHIKKQGLKGEVNFAGRVSQFELPALLNRAKVFVTTAQNGSLDKAILEAMACGLLVISMAPGSVSLPLGIAQTNNTADFITQLECVLKSGVFIKKEYVGFVKKNHSIQTLIPKILRSYV